MGDDMRDTCVYKFVSKGKFDPQNRSTNLELLTEGELYVTDFGKGKWLLLDYERNPKLNSLERF